MIHVVVPNWNGAATCGRASGRSPPRTYAELEIVVVDNGSTDDSLAVLDALAAEIAPVPPDGAAQRRNLGFAGGVNRGIRHALAAGADGRRPVQQRRRRRPRWLSTLQRVLDADPDVAIATGRLLMGDGADGRQHGRLLHDVGPGVPP